MISLGGRHVAGFGIGAWYTFNKSDELAALIKMSDDRMKVLNDAFQKFGPTWATVDIVAYSDFGNDLGLLNMRYSKAKSDATTLGFLAPIPDVRKSYDAISKAFRQNYQPDTSVVSPGDATVSDVKGDWADLWKRIAAAQKAAGAPIIVDQPSQELANLQSDSLAMQLYRATAPIDIISQVTGGMDVTKWIDEHKVAITVVATVVIGGIVYAVIRR